MNKIMKKIFLKILSVFSFMCMFMLNVNIIGGVQDSNRPKVSIIVPVYNVEKWLPECMDSLINQTLEDIEIICIDDGSPDNCGKILDEYAEKDKEKFKRERIKVIHQENQGVSVARNAGLDIASGEYITFVDPDDYVHPKTYETAYKWAKKDDVDLLKFSCRHFKDGKDNFDVNDIDLSDGKIQNVDKYLFNNISVCSWNHLFKYDLIKGKDNNVRFVPNMKISEDGTFNYMVFAKAKNIKCIPGRFYNKRGRSGSADSGNTFDYKWNESKSIFKNVCDYWRMKKCLKGREHIVLTSLLGWGFLIYKQGCLKDADEVLNSFGSDIYNKEVTKKCPQKVQSIIKQLEQAAEKQRKIKKAA